MGKRKFAFIIAVNNEIYFEECTYYIKRLRVPEGFSVDILAIRDADSMCAAYNAAMQSSDARYKVYMHQDVMIRNVHFLERIIELFMQNDNVGMIGMLGGNQMPKTGMTYLAWYVGAVDCTHIPCKVCHTLHGMWVQSTAGIQVLPIIRWVHQI